MYQLQEKTFLKYSPIEICQVFSRHALYSDHGGSFLLAGRRPNHQRHLYFCTTSYLPHTNYYLFDFL